MESYATLSATVSALISLGFTRIIDDELFFDSPKTDSYGTPVVQAFVYRCANKYWCVDLDGGFRSPIVWDGPRAAWDKSNTTDEFVEWLDKEFAGWK